MFESTLGRVVGSVALVLVLPVYASAQTGSIAGVVKDNTGLVLPGVTVEASSPALIEKSRTVVTDGQGQYKIIDIKPGIYAVTFSLEGFTTNKRAGIELVSGVTAQINAELRVGGLEESITVSGASPVVDVQNARQQQVLTKEVMDAIPAGHNIETYGWLTPGVSGSAGASLTPQDVGGSVGDRNVQLRIHGSRGADMALMYDGMRYNNINGTAGGAHVVWSPNQGTVDEYQFQTGSMTADVDVSGVRTDVVPKHGSNTTQFSLFGNYTNSHLQSANGAPGATTVYDKIWDVNPSLGGSLLKDKVWYFGSLRWSNTSEEPPGTYSDTNPFDNVFTPGSQVVNPNKEGWQDIRLTWQASARNKVSIWWGAHQYDQQYYHLSSTTSPDAATILHTQPNSVIQVTWSSPLTNKVILDAGFTMHPEQWGNQPQTNLPWGTMPITELSTGLNYRAAATGYNWYKSDQMNVRFSAAYVTGSSALKVGFSRMWGTKELDNWALSPISLRVLNGVPNSLAQYTYPYNTLTSLDNYTGIFVQDQWTLKRLTLNAGLRYDALQASVPAQSYPAVPLAPARSFGEVTNVPNWKDINPRLGAVYDLQGNGKTSVKATIGRYVNATTTAFADLANPVVASVNSATRTWTDSNGNFLPDCNLTNPQTNGECGTLNNVLFGQQVTSTTYDPKMLNGWGKRGKDWEVQAAVQQELRQGVALSVTYTRHWWGNFMVTDNQAVSPSDYSQFCLNAPLNASLPNGGGYPVCGLFDLNPNKFGVVNNLVTLASNYGDMSDVYQGVDVSVTARMPGHIHLQGGTSTGHEVFDNCAIAGLVDNPIGGPVDTGKAGINNPFFGNLSGIASPSALGCHISPPMFTELKLLGSFPLPWYSVNVSATFQSEPPPMITASYTATTKSNPEILTSLGRQLSGGSTVVPLIAPGTTYGDRLNQLDVRMSKTFTTAKHLRIQPQFDIYNLFNAAPRLVQNLTYGASWLAPQAVLPGRLFKFGFQLDY